jgi:hypothetical protein
MIARAVNAGRGLAILAVFLAAISTNPAWAQSISLAWSPSSSPAVTGYKVFYGLASGNYTSVIDAGGQTSLTIPGLAPGATYYLAVLAYDAAGDQSLFSNEVTNSVPAPPLITAQPINQTVNAGAMATFAVTASGTPPLNFQWFDGAAALPGATNANLALANVSDANRGGYSVVISNSVGSLTSSVATLSVIDPPLIAIQPAAQTVVAGRIAFFQVSFSGTPPFNFQWFDGAAALPGATNATLLLVNVSDANGGSYSVVISNTAGSVTSSVAALSVIDPPVITTQPAAQSVGLGANVSFQVAASGTPPFTFQWFVAGAAIPTGTAATLHLTNVGVANAGNYRATVRNAASTTISAAAALTVTNPFASLTGAYNGLFYQTNAGNPAVAVPTAGMLANCIVSSNGFYSARVYIAGTSYPLTGTFSAAGSDSEIVSRAANGLPNLTLTLCLDLTGQTQTMTGLVSNMSAANPWTALLVADLATNTALVGPGNFGVLLLPQPGATNSPTADGSVSISVTTNGIVNLAGYMADETAVSQSVPVSQAGLIPFYRSLYGGLGLVEGWLSLAGSTPGGTLTWIRPAGVTNSLPFPLGFTNLIPVCGYYPDLLGIAGWWPFDEGSGAATIDASGAGNDGTLVNSPAWTNGVIGNALRFNAAATNYVSAPQPLPSISNFTIMLWARSSSSNANPYATLLENTAYSYGLVFFKGCCVFVGDGSGLDGASWANRLPDNGLWHHWAASWSAGVGILYIDGLARVTNTSMAMNPPGATLHIGGPGTSYYGPYSGDIDDVRIYSNVVSPATITRIYTNGLAARP